MASFFACFPGESKEESAVTKLQAYQRGKLARRRVAAQKAVTTQLKRKDNALMYSPRDVRATDEELVLSKPKSAAEEKVAFSKVKGVTSKAKTVVVVLKSGKPVVLKASSAAQADAVRKAIETLCEPYLGDKPSAAA